MYQNPQSGIKHLQVSVFGRQSQNEIIFVQNAQKISLPLNFAETRVFGCEGEWSFQLASNWSWAGSLSFTHSENRSEVTSLYGKELPNVPNWKNSQQLWWTKKFFSLGSDIYWIDGNYWDAPNQIRAPTRLVQNATMRFIWKAWQVELKGRNLWNRIVAQVPIDPLNTDFGKHPEAIQDFLGYPLSGRTFTFSFTWTPDLVKK